MLEKTYSSNLVESQIYSLWEQSGSFKAGAGSKANTGSFCIVMPPPNVTGSLHIGHALNMTLQDILVRYKRMQGYDVLWQPGMDHAGIATQMVVEREIAKANENRFDLGREALIDRIWQWKEKSGGTIFNQLKRLGVSCDWSRERFTMDEGLSKAVLEVFVQLYNEGLIYKDKRLVNWDPKLQTAISDLEVEQHEVQGHLWHLKYPIVGSNKKFIVVATTRPETILGDTAIAVHPDDVKYSNLIGQYAELPLVGRHIPIIADNYADPESGSGAVKITPAHDFNDFEVGKRHNLNIVNIMTANATIDIEDNPEFLLNIPQESGNKIELAIEKFHGLDRFDARKAVVDAINELGLLDKVETHTHNVPHGDRSGVPIEPFLTDQWYLDAKKLAAPAISAVREGRTNFIPKNWDKTYFEWMENIQPWCISRQLWWGHQIPVWYGPDQKIFVAKSKEEAQKNAFQHYGHTVELYQDPDVLDTWFSSALWPFSALGWPEKTPELVRYYQTDILMTAFDIIFFWVARMMMMGLHFMDKEPFHTIYIHALVRDENGAKMSKTKGNIIDPVVLIDEYGADALRFTLCSLAAAGRDIKLSKSRVEGYRNFITKIWNAARFIELNKCSIPNNFSPEVLTHPVNHWIISETSKTVKTIDKALNNYRFNEAAGAIYQFTWHTYCDWFLEFSKIILNGNNEIEKQETRATVIWAFREIIKMLHPFMPFVTEKLWSFTKQTQNQNPLITTSWPIAATETSQSTKEINWLMNLISLIRSIRMEINIPASKMIELVAINATQKKQDNLLKNNHFLKKMARVNKFYFTNEVPSNAVQFLAEDMLLAIPLKGIIDIETEKKRLVKNLDKLSEEISKIRTKLSNNNFVKKAPHNIVLKEQNRLNDNIEQCKKIASILERLDSIKA